ncbi:hypothetical protein [Pedobacter sp.]
MILRFGYYKPKRKPIGSDSEIVANGSIIVSGYVTLSKYSYI